MNETAPQSEFPLERIHAAHRQARLIVAAIGFTIISYVIVVEVLLRMQPGVVPAGDSQMLRIIFYTVAVIAIFSATVIKALLLRTAPATPEARLMRLQSTTIMSAAFAELPAIFGLVLFFLTRQRSDFYSLAVVAAYLIVRHLPQRETWENYVRRGADSR